MGGQLLYTELKDDYVQCQACLRECKISVGNTGICGNRYNQLGQLEDKLSPYNLTPNIIVVDKKSTLADKPILYLKDKNQKLVPSSSPVLSVGGYYCNLDCLECPNPSMSHPDLSSLNSAKYESPESVIKLAISAGIKFIALTYNEFVPFPETTMELTKKASESGLDTILITNTTFTKEFIDMFYDNGGRIARLDLKASISSGNGFYRKYCNFIVEQNGEIVTIDKILESIIHAKEIGLHVEIVSAITPQRYDYSNFADSEEFEETAVWMKEKLGPEIPWHLTLLRPKSIAISNIDKETIDNYMKLAKSVGLENVDIIEKMCDCREKDLFKKKSCCK